MNAWQHYIATPGRPQPQDTVRILLCVQCQRMELVEIQDGKIIRVAYWDDTPVLHR